MSVVFSVFLQASKMPSPAGWAEAIRSNGFDMELDRDFDPKSDVGFLPCKYAGQNAGFEYYWDPKARDGLEGGPAARIGNRDARADFITHSDMRELMASIIAGAVLCAMADGVLWDTEAGEFVSAAEALEWGKSMEADFPGGS